MVYFFGWIIFSFVSGYIGNSRKIGFWSAFLLSIFLSPLVGLIVALASVKKVTVKQVSPTMTKLISEGNKLFKDGKIDEAIEKFNLALTYSDKAPNTNFKLSQLYSLKKNGENSLNHITKAIQDGFNNFEKINHDNDLSYLRGIADFKTFVANGYKMLTV